jgi:hypothetical protein
MVATRRTKAALIGAASAAGLTLGAWAVLGFAGFGDYLPTLRLLVRLEQRTTYGLLGMGLKFGLPLPTAYALAVGLALCLLAAAENRISMKNHRAFLVVATPTSRNPRRALRPQQLSRPSTTLLGTTPTRSRWRAA